MDIFTDTFYVCCVSKLNFYLEHNRQNMCIIFYNQKLGMPILTVLEKMSTSSAFCQALVCFIADECVSKLHEVFMSQQKLMPSSDYRILALILLSATVIGENGQRLSSNQHTLLWTTAGMCEMFKDERPDDFAGWILMIRLLITPCSASFIIRI